LLCSVNLCDIFTSWEAKSIERSTLFTVISGLTESNVAALQLIIKITKIISLMQIRNIAVTAQARKNIYNILIPHGTVSSSERKHVTLKKNTLQLRCRCTNSTNLNCLPYVRELQLSQINPTPTTQLFQDLTKGWKGLNCDTLANTLLSTVSYLCS
jgi:hypothetical protein